MVHCFILFAYTMTQIFRFYTTRCFWKFNISTFCFNSKDADLESRLMPMLKEILHERAQRCIEDLRSFIAKYQPSENQKPILAEGQLDLLE